jgi:hypothetical protein
MKKHHRKAKVDSTGKAPKTARVGNENDEINDEHSPEGHFVEDDPNPAELFSIAEVAKMVGLEEQSLVDRLVEDGVFYREGEGMPARPHAEWIEKGYFVMVPEDTPVPEKGGAPIIEEMEALDRLAAVRDQLIEVNVQISQIEDQFIAVTEQIIAIDMRFIYAAVPFFEIVNDSARADCIRGMSEDVEMRENLLKARNAMLARMDDLLSEKRRLISAAQRGYKNASACKNSVKNTSVPCE